jgi:hypothetical protein
MADPRDTQELARKKAKQTYYPSPVSPKGGKGELPSQIELAPGDEDVSNSLKRSFGGI